jgi:hypothetical protein
LKNNITSITNTNNINNYKHAMLFENNSNNVNSKNQNINRVASLESPPPSDIDSNNHSHTAYFDADISTVPKAECQNTLNVLNSTSLALGDRSIPRFVHDTDRAFEIEPASSLSQLCSASTATADSTILNARSQPNMASSIESSSSQTPVSVATGASLTRPRTDGNDLTCYYNIFNKNRATHAGGVAIYIEEGIESFELTNKDMH